MFPPLRSLRKWNLLPAPAADPGSWRATPNAAQKCTPDLLLCGVLRNPDDHGKKWVLNIRDDDPDRVRATVGEAARQQVGPVVQLLDSAFDSLPQRLTHMALAVDDCRHGKDGDARFFRYIVNAGGLGRFSFAGLFS